MKRWEERRYGKVGKVRRPREEHGENKTLSKSVEDAMRKY